MEVVPSLQVTLALAPSAAAKTGELESQTVARVAIRKDRRFMVSLVVVSCGSLSAKAILKRLTQAYQPRLCTAIG